MWDNMHQSARSGKYLVRNQSGRGCINCRVVGFSVSRIMISSPQITRDLLFSMAGAMITKK